MEYVKQNTLSEVKIGDDVRWSDIDIADNGWVVNWSEYGKREKFQSQFDECSHVSRKHLFDMHEVDEAFELLKIIKKKELEGKRNRG